MFYMFCIKCRIFFAFLHFHFHFHFLHTTHFGVFSTILWLVDTAIYVFMCAHNTALLDYGVFTCRKRNTPSRHVIRPYCRTAERQNGRTAERHILVKIQKMQNMFSGPCWPVCKKMQNANSHFLHFLHKSCNFG